MSHGWGRGCENNCFTAKSIVRKHSKKKKYRGCILYVLTRWSLLLSLTNRSMLCRPIKSSNTNSIKVTSHPLHSWHACTALGVALSMPTHSLTMSSQSPPKRIADSCCACCACPCIKLMYIDSLMIRSCYSFSTMCLFFQVLLVLLVSNFAIATLFAGCTLYAYTVIHDIAI